MSPETEKQPQQSPKKHAPKVHVAARHAVSKDQQSAEKQSLTTARKSALFLVVVALVYILYLIFSGQGDDLVSSLAKVSQSWIFGALFMYLCYFILGTLAYVVAVVVDPKSPLGLRDLMSVEAAGIFFSKLTPNGTGGAPAQIFRLTRAGLSMGQAGALQYTRFIIYEAAEGLFAAIMLLFRGQYFVDTFGNVFVIGAFLFGFKIFEVAGLLLLCLCPRFVQKAGNSLLRFGKKIKVVRHPEKYRELLNSQVHDFSSGFKSAASNWRAMLLTLAITMLQLACVYSLPFFILNSLGKPADLITCLAAGSMIELLTSAIPLPGGTGGAEGGFAFLFKDTLGPALPAAYILWRGCEYFLPILSSIPLLGLRSKGGTSLNKRYKKLRKTISRIYSRLVGKKEPEARELRVKVKDLKRKSHQQISQRNKK